MITASKILTAAQLAPSYTACMRTRRLLFSLLFSIFSACAHPPGGKVKVESVAPRPEDVSSIDGLMRAFYDVVNIAPEAPRQWSRDRTLYSPWIRFVGSGRALKVYEHQSLVDDTEPMVQRGFRERELHRIVRQYGNIAQVVSAYETRSGPLSELSRGVNYLQLYHDGTRWWVASVIWQSEDLEHPIPPELTGTAAAAR